VGADHFRIIRDRLVGQRHGRDTQIVCYIAVCVGCFIARYTEATAFKTTLLLHEALLIIAS